MSISPPIERAFGAWESGVTSKAITAGSVRLGSLSVIDDELYWLEGRSNEGGRYVLCRYDPDHPMASSRYAVDVSPSNVNVRTRVHEYGGGAVVPGKGQVFFSDFATQQIFQQNLSMGDAEVALKPITPDDDPDHPHRFRFADGVLDSSGSKIYSIREDHFHDEPSKVVNEIVSINVETGEMTVLASGNDFYSNPRLAPDGKHLAYVTWNHPNMPWDSTELCVLDFETLSTSKIAGDGDTSIIQPVWHPVTNHLYYLSDRSGYYNLYVAGSEESILPDMSLMTGLSWTDLPNGLQTYRLRRQRK